MRRCLVTLNLVALLSTLPLRSACAAEDAAAIVAAGRQLEMAQLRLRLYEREEYPRKLHRLKRDIELAKAHIESYHRRVKEYEQFDKLRYSSPLFLTLEETRLSLRQAELKLEDLEEERSLWVRHHRSRRRLYALEVEAARARLLAATEKR